MRPRRVAIRRSRLKIRRARAREPSIPKPEEDDRVERAERGVDGIDGEQPSISDSSPPAGLDGTWRGVDPDDVEPTLLQVEANSTAAATDVENAAANEAHRPALDRVVPPRERNNEISGVEGHDEAVIPFDDLHRTLARENVGEEGTPDIVL